MYQIEIDEGTEMIRRLEQRILRAYELANNVLYYLQRGHRLGDAIRMARMVIPAGRR